jgi:hypothetical protein
MELANTRNATGPGTSKRINMNQARPQPQSMGSGFGETPSDSWEQHEHLSAQLELDALRLLADAGTPELAKFAIDSVDGQQQDQLRTEFAQALGFVSYGDLVSASIGVSTNDDKLWFVTPLRDGYWAAWNFTQVCIDVKYTTREAAVAHVEKSAAKSLA